MTTPETTTAVTMYDKIENPVVAIEQLGTWFARSGMFGCEKLESGMILAMACLVERKSPFEIMRTYHLINGTLSKRTEAMLADFNRAGGKHLWTKFTNEIATLKVTFGEFKDYEVSYTIQDAEQAGLCGPKGAMRSGQKGAGTWQKQPDAMLRARCVSKCLRMVAPEIVAGIYTPEEVQDFRSDTIVTSSAPLLAIQKPAITVDVVETVQPQPQPEQPKRDITQDPAIKKVQEVLGGEITSVETKPQLEELLKGIEDDANEWLMAKGWMQEDQTFKDLPSEKAKDIMSRIREFKIALKTFKEVAKKVKEKEKESK